jgi:Uma2 family endonuclease
MSATLEIMDRATHVEVPEPASELERDRDHVVVLRGVPWVQYEALLDVRGEAPRPRMAYLDGELEIMTTGRRHEIGKKMLARLLEAYCEERDISLNAMGNTTFKKKAKKVGLEPDECYCIGRLQAVPGLAIEIVHTSSGIDKLEIYRRLGVGEVWFWIDGCVWVYGQVGGRFHELSRSAAVRGIDLHELARVVLSTDDSRQTQAVRAYRRSLSRRPRR